MTAVDSETGEALATISRDEAARLTSEIKGHVGQIWRLLSRAHETRAYLALGYTSWASYVETEFEMSRSNAYRLLDLAKVVHELDTGLIAVSWNIPEDEAVSRARDISARDAEALAPLLGQPALTEAFIDADRAAEAEGRKRTSEDLKEAAEARKEPPPPPITDTDPDSPWAKKRRAEKAEADRLAAEAKALDAARKKFRDQLAKTHPLLEQEPAEIAGLLADSDNRPTLSTLLNLAGWAADLAHRLDPNLTLESM